MARRTRKTYSELLQFDSFMDRFNYLKLSGRVGEETFGRGRPLNQALYRNPKWKSLRNQIIYRDHGCDMGLIAYEIPSFAIVHHIYTIQKISSLLDSIPTTQYTMEMQISYIWKRPWKEDLTTPVHGRSNTDARDNRQHTPTCQEVDRHRA